MTGRFDRSDPAVRVEDALRRFARAQRIARWSLALVLGSAALAAPFVVDATVGRPGSLIGALVLSALLVGLAVVVRPWTWSPQELEHHRLEAIWSEARSDAAEKVPWERYAAWALAAGERVELLELTCAPSTSPAPRRLRQQRGERFAAEAMSDAAAAMETLRQRCEDRELAARQAHVDGRLRAEQQADDEALSAVERAAARAQRDGEARMRREVAAEDAAGRRAEAAALAAALRRP